mgnify:CR=1 FL=1|tara:strand:+ start:3084 stop:4340 length:1257 start_codon:yes stop_codon:yes gene_type:complete
MNVLTVCSGIGAPECAWTPLGFNFVGASEIEPFPSAVLEHHYPDVPNFGDLNNYKDWKLDETDINVICGGTPCQAFSVAGLRRGLDDSRGNLSLVFIQLCERVQPEFIVWENVPGVLSSNGGRDYAAFTGALSEIGYSFAWRILDAQFFGVPQRRRRVFLVGYRGNWRYPAAVLFEPQSMRGDTPKSGKAGEDIAPAVTTGAPYAWTGNERVEAEALVLQVYENHATDSRITEVDVSPTITARWGTGGNNTPIALNRMRGFGDYTESNHASALKARDYKDATDSVLWRQTTPTDYKADTVTETLMAQMSKRATDILAVHENQRSELRLTKEHPPLTTGGGKPGQGYPCIVAERARRIMPIEAERLQGFPDNYTNITYRGKPAPDSQRYKALGNSMAVPVLRWIGERMLRVKGVIDEHA